MSFWDLDYKPAYEGEEKPKDSWFLSSLKAMTLLHAAQKYVGSVSSYLWCKHG